MKNFIFSIIVFATLTSFAQTNNNYLIRVCQDSICELGTPSGYINYKGDTIIRMGQYHYCYTDTIKYFGIVLDTSGQCLAINNLGQFLYNIKWYDNGPDYVSEGLFRIQIDGKTGYANTKGEIIIVAKYECTTPFEKGRAKVTYNCDLIDDREHKVMNSESWFYIDTKGNKIE